jgi:UDP-N-acetylmuramoyl-tripeptide--D-alanyl-D-alanine ligase
VLAAAPSMVFTVGPLMLHLREQLPADLLGQHADRPEDIAGTVADNVRDGDVVLVKGSLGTRMAPIVAALRALRPAPIAINGH